MDLIAGELDIEVPTVSIDVINNFLTETNGSYRKSAFFKEDSIYKDRNNREYPWDRRVLEFQGIKICPYDEHIAFIPLMGVINKIPVNTNKRTVILIVQKEQKDYDFNFHFDGDIDYGFRICNGLDTKKVFLEFSKLKPNYIQHAQNREKIENYMVDDKVYQLIPKKSNTVLCINRHQFPHRVPVNESSSRFVLIVTGPTTGLEDLKFSQLIKE